VAGGEEEIKQPLLCFSFSHFLYLVFLALKKMQHFLEESSSGDMHTLYQDQHQLPIQMFNTKMSEI
jgi:hypothetical protein